MSLKARKQTISLQDGSNIALGKNLKPRTDRSFPQRQRIQIKKKNTPFLLSFFLGLLYQCVEIQFIQMPFLKQ